MSPSVSARLLLTQSDMRLAAFARAGHERAFEALVQRYRRPLLGYCQRLLLSPERAEDALQQALLGAWLALRAGAEVSDVKAWLYKIVHNAALNALRVSGYDYRKLNESLSGADAPQEDLDRRIAVREALAGLAALPEMQREALLRTAVEGRTHHDVARDLGLSESALRGLVYRARATLRSAAGAIVPPPLVTWALGSSGSRGVPVVERLVELGAGGGSAGVAGLLVKGGAVAVTAGVLAGGIAAVHTHPKLERSHVAAHTARHAVPPSRGAPVALASARAVSATPIATVRTTSSHSDQFRAHRLAPRPRRVSTQPSAMPFSTSAPPHPSSTARRPGGQRGGRADGGHSHDETLNLDSSGSGGGAPAMRSGSPGHDDTAQAEQGSNGNDSNSGGSSAPSENSGGPTDEATSRSGDGGNAAPSQNRGDGARSTSQFGESSDRLNPSGGSSSTGTTGPSKDGLSSTSEGSKGD